MYYKPLKSLMVTEQNKSARHQRSYSTIEKCSTEKGKEGVIRLSLWYTS